MYYMDQRKDKHLTGKILIFLIASLVMMGIWAYIMVMTNPSPPQIQYYYVNGKQ